LISAFKDVNNKKDPYIFGHGTVRCISWALRKLWCQWLFRRGGGAIMPRQSTVCGNSFRARPS